MAWFAVQREFFTHPKVRDAAKQLRCSQNEVSGCLFRFWNWCFDNADQIGMIKHATEDDIAEAISYGLSKDLKAAEVVKVLIETGWIDKDDGVLYAHDWEDWQKEYYKMIEARNKAAERKRNERARKKVESAPEKNLESSISLPGPIIPHEEDVQGKTEPKPDKKPSEEYPEGFKKFWDVYPRKVGKGEAYKKYKARTKSGWSPDDLYAAAVNYAAQVKREKTETIYIKHPSTFLSDTEPFTDYLPHKQEHRQMVVEENEDNPYSDWGEET